MKAKKPAREDRLAAALRENLKRRKARGRALARAADSNSVSPPETRPNKVKKPE